MLFEAIFKFLRDLNRPSPRDQNAHWFYCTAVAHSIAGAAGFSLLTFFYPEGISEMKVYLVNLVIVLTYFIFKELRDVKKGGAFYDSVTDTSFIALGAFYAWSYFFHLILVAALLVTAVREVWLSRRS